MDKKILVSMMVIGLVAALAGAGLHAYFNDTETSTGNTFRAGTLDLDAPGDAIVSVTNAVPGTECGPYTINLHNSGSLPGALTATIDYVDSDGTQPTEFPGTVSADDFAAKLYVTYAHYIPAGGTERDVLADWKSYADVNHDNNLSIYEMKVAGTWTFTETLTAGGTHTLVLKLTLDSGVGNDFQADGISVTITFTLTQG